MHTTRFVTFTSAEQLIYHVVFARKTDLFTSVKQAQAVLCLCHAGKNLYNYYIQRFALCPATKVQGL